MALFQNKLRDHNGVKRDTLYNELELGVSIDDKGLFTLIFHTLATQTTHKSYYVCFRSRAVVALPFFSPLISFLDTKESPKDMHRKNCTAIIHRIMAGFYLKLKKKYCHQQIEITISSFVIVVCSI